jgi:hypothetical protein
MPTLLEDHGLPLVQLKEWRRDLIVALMGQQTTHSVRIYSAYSFVAMAMRQQ